MMKLFTSVLLLLLAGTAFLGYTRPTYTKIQDLQAQSAQLDGILSEATEFQRLKSQLMTRYNSLPSDSLARLNKLLPDHVDNVRLILDVDSLAAQYHLGLDNVVINKATDATASGASSGSAAGSSSSDATTVLGALGAQKVPYGSLTLQFRTVGTYADFTQFLRALQSSLRLVDVIGLTMSTGGVDANGKVPTTPTYSYTLKVQTYWLK